MTRPINYIDPTGHVRAEAATSRYGDGAGMYCIGGLGGRNRSNSNDSSENIDEWYDETYNNTETKFFDIETSEEDIGENKVINKPGYSQVYMSNEVTQSIQDPIETISFGTGAIGTVQTVIGSTGFFTSIIAIFTATDSFGMSKANNGDGIVADYIVNISGGQPYVVYFPQDDQDIE